MTLLLYSSSIDNAPTEGNQMKTSDVRRENLRRLIARSGGASALAQRLGYAGPSFLAQLAGPNPTREVTERTARTFESKLGLPDRALDAVPADPTPAPALPRGRPPSAPAQPVNVAVIADVIRLVGSVLQGEQVATPGPERFADLVSLAVTDALEHGGVPREHHIRSVVRLMKG